mmetsp:Transcript_23122/g.64294  ORF Transcript_23122/g.64294 Transcript_23122/m.64294 type:complete len:106 (-) Transcript_23122:556-873(-)
MTPRLLMPVVLTSISMQPKLEQRSFSTLLKLASTQAALETQPTVFTLSKVVSRQLPAVLQIYNPEQKSLQDDKREGIFNSIIGAKPTYHRVAVFNFCTKTIRAST